MPCSIVGMCFDKGLGLGQAELWSGKEMRKRWWAGVIGDSLCGLIPPKLFACGRAYPHETLVYMLNRKIV
jgi:hypothetical protein